MSLTLDERTGGRVRLSGRDHRGRRLGTEGCTRRIPPVSRVTKSLQQLQRPLSRILAFGLLPAVSLLSTLVVLPILSARFGLAGWSSVLLGQSIGAAASVVCALAWPSEGAHLVAQASPEQRVRMYRASVMQRSAALVVAAPLVIATCLLTRPDMPLVCVLSGLALSLNAFTSGWYFVGVSRPSQMLVAEGIPRLMVNLLSVALVVFLPLWTYPVALMAGMLGTVLITFWFIRRDAAGTEAAGRGDPLRPGGGRFPVIVLLARSADAGSSYLSVPLVALIAPAAYPLFAAVDRLASAMINVMATVAQGLTAWIGEASDRTRHRRIAGAVLLASAASAIVFLASLAAIPWLARYVFAGTVQFGTLVACLAAARIAATFLSRALVTILLVPQEMAITAYIVGLVVACVTLALVALTAAGWGGIAPIGVMAVVPFAAVVIQMALGLRRLRARTRLSVA
jgi:hypothetical protein